MQHPLPLLHYWEGTVIHLEAERRPGVTQPLRNLPEIDAEAFFAASPRARVIKNICDQISAAKPCNTQTLFGDLQKMATLYYAGRPQHFRSDCGELEIACFSGWATAVEIRVSSAAPAVVQPAGALSKTLGHFAKLRAKRHKIRIRFARGLEAMWLIHRRNQNGKSVA
jgi:hypothetical protein